MDVAPKCRKCNGDLDRKGKPEWCKSCWAAYHREYEGTKDEMLAARAFADGAEAMRKLLVHSFLKYGAGYLYGIECAKYIHGTPAPRYGDPQIAPPPQPLPNKTEARNEM